MKQGHAKSQNFLTTEDFDNGAGRLNMQAFKKIEKAITSDELMAKKDTHNIYTQKSLQKYLSDRKNSVEKGGDSNVIAEAKQLFASLQKFTVVSEGKETDVWLQAKSAPISNEIQKSHLTEAFGYGDNINFQKKGSEITEKMQSVCEDEKVEQNAFLTQMIVLKSEIGEEPDEAASEWAYRGYYGVIPEQKMYSYTKCCEKFQPSIGNNDIYSKHNATNPPTEVEIKAKKMRDYNDVAMKYIDSCCECALMAIYIKNLAPDKNYDLTPKQLTILKF